VGQLTWRLTALLAWLKEKRLAKGFSMRELAEKLECSHSLISKVEQGERRLDVVEYVDYCKALDVNPVEGINLIKDQT
jgi:transcriptional regulator with XRE-family HTH domain